MCVCAMEIHPRKCGLFSKQICFMTNLVVLLLFKTHIYIFHIMCCSVIFIIHYSKIMIDSKHPVFMCTYSQTIKY